MFLLRQRIGSAMIWCTLSPCQPRLRRTAVWVGWQAVALIRDSTLAWLIHQSEEQGTIPEHWCGRDESRKTPPSPEPDSVRLTMHNFSSMNGFVPVYRKVRFPDVVPTRIHEHQLVNLGTSDHIVVGCESRKSAFRRLVHLWVLAWFPSQFGASYRPRPASCSGCS